MNDLSGHRVTFPNGAWVDFLSKTSMPGVYKCALMGGSTGTFSDTSFYFWKEWPGVVVTKTKRQCLKEFFSE